MKKVLLVLGMVALTFSMNAQVKQKTSFVHKVEGKTKQEIFSAIRQWVALNYNSAMNVVQLSDFNGGALVVKGINTLIIKNTLAKISMPNNSFVLDSMEVKVNHVMDFQVRDGKYKLSFSFDKEINPLTEKQTKEILDRYLDTPFISKKKEILFGKGELTQTQDIQKEIVLFMDMTNVDVLKKVKESSSNDDW